jgi:hypothetical protein
MPKYSSYFPCLWAKTWLSKPKNYLVAKMESGHQVGLGILKFRILFNLMINYMKFFECVITIFKNHMFKVGLYIFIKIK